MRPDSSVSAAVMDSPLDYATASVARLMRQSLPVYLALAVATALPGVAFLFRSAIVVQGVRLGGEQAGREFGHALEMLAIIAASIGLLQISLILGRILSRRRTEYRVLLAIVMRPSQLFRVILYQSALHAMVGWCAGSTLTFATTLLARVLGGFPGPALEDFLAPVALGIPFCLAAVVAPTLATYALRVTRGDGPIEG